MKFSKLLIGIGFIAIVFSSCKSCNNKTTDNAGNSLIDSLTKINPAIGNLTKQIASDSKNPELFFARGTMFYQMHQLDLAAKDLHQAIQLDSTKIPYFLTFADVNIEARYVPLAMQYLERAKRLAPDDRELALKLAKTYLYLKEYDAVIRETNSVLSVDPNSANSFILQGIVWKEKGDSTKAINLFKNAVDADPNNYDAYMQLGLLNANKNHALAEKYLMNAIRIDSNRYEGNYALGYQYQMENNYQKAIKQYRKMMIEYPQDAQLFYNIGWMYMQMDSMQKAFSHFNLAVSNAPTNADAYYMRGLCWEKRGNKTEAARDYQNALNIRSNFPDASEGLKRVK